MQNGLQQLDLFGMPAEMPAEPKKKERMVKAVTAPIAEAAPPVPEASVAVEEIPVVKVKTPKPAVAEKTTKVVGKRGRKSFKEMDSEAGLIDIPDEEILKQKLYYSISEVAGWFKVNTSLLRYWENEFDILQPRKTRKGDRLFRVEDIRNLQLIYYLLRQRKFSIDGAKNYLRNNRREADAQAQLMDALTRFRSFLLELKASL
jgi:DNA-binding transcriptional MerR regulator